MAKRALITGVSGQDGAYLSELLLRKGYHVIGGDRRAASNTFWRLKKLNILKMQRLSTLIFVKNQTFHIQ